jgi:hypothetical protein
MTEYVTRLLSLGVLSILISACQSVDTLKLKQLKQPTNAEKIVRIYCTGTPDCEFSRLDKTQILDANSGRVTQQAMQQKLVRLQTKHVKDANSLYLTVPAGQHELIIRFYPITKDKAETFHVFHNFKAGQKYTAYMYRKRINRATSLLNASTPDPLCVDLKQAEKTIRRFCKPYNAETGIAEFVEQKI